MHTDPATHLLTLQSELIGKQLETIAALQAQIRALDGTDFEANVHQAKTGYFLATFDGAPLPCEYEGDAQGVEVTLIFVNGEGIEPHHLMSAAKVRALESEIAIHCATRNESCRWEMTL